MTCDDDDDDDDEIQLPAKLTISDFMFVSLQKPHFEATRPRYRTREGGQPA